MIKNIYILCLNEWKKILRVKFYYVGPIFCLCISLIWLKGVESVRGSENVTGYLFLTTGMQISITTIIPLFVLLFSLLAVSWETSNGTICLNFFHPIRRIEFFISKLLTAIMYLLLLLFLNVAGLYIVGALKFGFKEYSAIGGLEISLSKFFLNILIACFFTFLVLLSVFSYGILISTITKNLASSIGFGLGIFYGLEPIRHLIRIDSFDPNKILFMNFLDKPASVIIDWTAGFDINWAKNEIIYSCLILQLITVFVFLSVSLFIFFKRDIKNVS